MKQLYDVGEEKPTRPYYQVIYQGEVVFWHECYSICNSYICRNMLQGVRPKPAMP